MSRRCKKCKYKISGKPGLYFLFLCTLCGNSIAINRRGLYSKLLGRPV